MKCKILDGLKISKDIKRELSLEISEFKTKTNITPNLRAILVGQDSASEIYINKKIKACKEVGINGEVIKLNSIDGLEDVIRQINEDNSIHGYILQLPLPNKLDPLKYFELFDKNKDVDVFHPENVGLLVQNKPRFKPCTPHAIQELLNRSGIKTHGKKVAIINRSNVVGKPLANMLIQDCSEFANATVTICHDKTIPEVLKEITYNSDIIIVAVGILDFLKSDMVKPFGVEQVIIDVGINRLENKIFGDVSVNIYEDSAKIVSPVPGGVGPLTVTMLMKNTLQAAKLSIHK